MISVSIGSQKTPPFFIEQGKCLNGCWFDKIKGYFRSILTGICSRVAMQNCFPASSSVIKLCDNGSMEIDLLHAAIKQIAIYITEIVGDETITLTIDGLASQNCFAWIDECKLDKTEAVLAHYNESNFIQPCEQAFDRHYKRIGGLFLHLQVC